MKDLLQYVHTRPLVALLFTSVHKFKGVCLQLQYLHCLGSNKPSKYTFD